MERECFKVNITCPACGTEFEVKGSLDKKLPEQTGFAMRMNCVVCMDIVSLRFKNLEQFRKMHNVS